MSMQASKHTTNSYTHSTNDQQNARGFFHHGAELRSHLQVNPAAVTPFAGRLGGNQAFVLDRTDPENESVLARVPDAAPGLTFRQIFDLRGFTEPILYKAGLIEMLVSSLLVFATDLFALSPNVPPPPGAVSTIVFVRTAAGATQAGILISLAVYGFGSVSGAHFNPLITIGTFFARLTTFPRMVIYVGAQTVGAALAGLMLRASQQSRDWKVGGCFMFEPATVGGAFAVEIMGSLLALFLAFGVGLDPRQREVYGPALAPALVGLVIGSLALSFSFALEGYGGASINPGRCFGAFIGSRFPTWHWIHWVAIVVASAVHGFLYSVLRPQTFESG